MEYFLGALATITAGLVTWLLQRKGEHEKWAREVRRLAYSEFLAAANTYLRTASHWVGAREAELAGEATDEDVSHNYSLFADARQTLEDEYAELSLVAHETSRRLAEGTMEWVDPVRRNSARIPYGRGADDDPADRMRESLDRLLTQFRNDLQMSDRTLFRRSGHTSRAL